MPETRKLLATAVACVTVLALAACSEWPPHSEKLSQQLRERNSAIEALVTEFQKTEFDRLDCQFCFANRPLSEWRTVSYRLVNEQWEKSEIAESRKFTELFWNAGISYVARSPSGETELGMYIPADTSMQHYVIQVFHNPDHGAGSTRECTPEFSDIDCGWCKVSVNDRVWIRYQWYLNDPDPAASRARDGGEMSRDEWQARHREAEDACLKAGMIEQGYVFDQE